MAETASESKNSLQVRFAGVPKGHDGRSAFTFELRFSEAVALGAQSLRDELEVRGGRVTQLRRALPQLRSVASGERRWEIAVEPDGRGNVTIALAAPDDCAATGAVCTPDGRTLSEGVTATVTGPGAGPKPAAGLTARFAEAPSEHDGASAFTVRIAFSEAVRISYRTFRDESVSVTGGRVTAARRVDGRRDLWEVTVAPDSYGDVTIALAAGRACGEPGALCTADGRALADGIAALVRGPAALSVADARVREAPGAELAFAVTLDRAASGPVTVGYASADGSATAGTDYTATSGTLTFAAGETAKTVAVPVLDDAIDEGEETLTLRLSKASGARIADATATGTIENSDPMPKAWLARFGRTVGNQVLEAVGERLDGGPHLTVGGVRLGGAAPHDALPSPTFQDWPASGMAAEAGPGVPEARLLGTGTGRAVTERDLLLGSSFHLVSGPPASGGPALAAWGRVSTGGFRGAVDDVTLDGDVSTGFLGFDAAWQRLLAGLVLAHSEADGAYALMGSDRGTIKSALTGVYPYARLRLSDRLSAWGLAGLGSGALTLTRPGQTPIDTALAMRLGAVGIAGTLLEGAGGLALSVKFDALWVRSESDAAVGLAGAVGRASRLRLILEGARPFTVSAGATLTPTLQIGLRRDGGDAETGTGVEVGAGMRYTAGVLTIEGQVRALLAHEASAYEEWGASGAVRLSPDASGLGPSLALMPAWGAASSGVARLWSQPGTSTLVAAGALASSPGRLDAEVSYGLSALGGRGVLTPYARAALAEDDSRAWHLGARLQMRESFNLSLEGSRRQRDGKAAAHDLALRASVPW